MLLPCLIPPHENTGCSDRKNGFLPASNVGRKPENGDGNSAGRTDAGCAEGQNRSGIHAVSLPFRERPEKNSPAATARLCDAETAATAPALFMPSCRSLCTVLKDRANYTIFSGKCQSSKRTKSPGGRRRQNSAQFPGSNFCFDWIKSRSFQKRCEKGCNLSKPVLG